jgi:hypothetical protein
MACGPDSRFGTLAIRHRIQSNFSRETLLTVAICDTPGTQKGAAFPLDACLGLFTSIENRKEQLQLSEVNRIGLTSGRK